MSDATSLPLADNSYDVVLCQMGLMFMENQPGALAEMRRVVVPGGRVVVNTPGAIQPAFVAMEQAIVEHISADWANWSAPSVLDARSRTALATLLRDAGRHAVSVKASTARLELRRRLSSCGNTST